MKTYTIDELDKIFEGETYPYVALYSDANKVLVHYRSNTMTKKEGWEKVKQRLQGVGLPEGFYMVKGKSSPDKKVTPDVFYFKKGNPDVEPLPTAQLAEAPPKVDQVLTYDAAIKSNKEISDLTAEVSRLLLEIKQKDECIADLEADLGDSEIETRQLAEQQNVGNGQQYLKDLMVAAVPIADEYFKVRNREIALKEQQMNGGYPPPPIQQPQQPQQPQQAQQPHQPPLTKEDAKKYWDKMGELLKTDPQAYQLAMQEAHLEQVEQFDDE